MAGLGVGLATFIVLGLTGVIGPEGEGDAALIFVQYLALFIAGYVAGRLSHQSSVVDGGLAALTVYVVTATIGVAGGGDPGAGALLLFGIIAAVLGSAGGVLADARHGRRR